MNHRNFATAAALVLLGVAQAQGAYTLQYVFDQPSYSANTLGGKINVTLSLKETVSGADTSYLGGDGLTGGGVRLLLGGSSASVHAAGDIVALSGLSKTVDLSEGGSVGFSGFTFTNIVADPISNGDGSTSYVIPVARFSFTTDANGTTTLATAAYKSGSFTYSDATDLDPLVSFGNTSDITVSVPEPAMFLTALVGSLGLLRRHRA